MSDTRATIFLFGVLIGFCLFWIPEIINSIFDYFTHRNKTKTGVYHVSKDSEKTNDGE